MDGSAPKCSTLTPLQQELYYLIARYLSSGPCAESAKLLQYQLERNLILPARIDWQGNEHVRTFDEMVAIDEQVHINDNHLGSLFESLVEKNTSCDSSSQDQNRESGINKPTTALAALYHMVKDVKSRSLSVTNMCRPLSFNINMSPGTTALPPCTSRVLVSRELNGTSHYNHIIPVSMYESIQRQKRLFGHLAAIYCLSFDRTGRYIFTGADDSLVKVWESESGRLLATLRGHSAEVSDMDVNRENTLVAAGCCDKYIRVWNLANASPVAVLKGHTGGLTNLNFCPWVSGNMRYLVSTGTDGGVCFWQYNIVNNHFNTVPIKFLEKKRPGSKTLVASFSKGGAFLVTGNTDHYVRVYMIRDPAPENIAELSAHQDRVDSIQFCHSGLRFVSGSKDGSARIWTFAHQEWSSILLSMATKRGHQSYQTDDAKISKQKVSMVGWSLDDKFVLTSVTEPYNIKLWDSKLGTLVGMLKGHEDEVFVIECHPHDARIIMSAGHDGKLILWDINTMTHIKIFHNHIERFGQGPLFDARFSPDGHTIATTDAHGTLCIYSRAGNDKYRLSPYESFFHTDYHQLIRDGNSNVLDAETEIAPHLMPPPYLIDSLGSPYPADLQRLVPGRERCVLQQNVPRITLNDEGYHEIVTEPIPEAPANPASSDAANNGNAGAGTSQEQQHNTSAQSAGGEDNLPTIDDMIELLEHQISVRGSNSASTTPTTTVTTTRVTVSSSSTTPGASTSSSTPGASTSSLAPGASTSTAIHAATSSQISPRTRQSTSTAGASTSRAVSPRTSQPTFAAPVPRPENGSVGALSVDVSSGDALPANSSPVMSPREAFLVKARQQCPWTRRSMVPAIPPRSIKFDEEDIKVISSQELKYYHTERRRRPVSGSAAAHTSTSSHRLGGSRSGVRSTAASHARRLLSDDNDDDLATVERRLGTASSDANAASEPIGDRTMRRTRRERLRRGGHGATWGSDQGNVRIGEHNTRSRGRGQLRPGLSIGSESGEEPVPVVSGSEASSGGSGSHSSSSAVSTPDTSDSNSSRERGGSTAANRSTTADTGHRAVPSTSGSSESEQRLNMDSLIASDSDTSDMDWEEAVSIRKSAARNKRKETRPSRSANKKQQARSRGKFVSTAKAGARYERGDSKKVHKPATGRKQSDNVDQQPSTSTSRSGRKIGRPKKKNNTKVVEADDYESLSDSTSSDADMDSPAAREKQSRLGKQRKMAAILNKAAMVNGSQRAKDKDKMSVNKGVVSKVKPSTPNKQVDVPKKTSTPQTNKKQLPIATAGPTSSGVMTEEDKRDVETYKFPEWLTSSVPRKAPYVPQLDDIVVYFIQGHQLYVDSVKSKPKHRYNIDEQRLPWNISKLKLREHETLRVKNIDYMIKPPRVCHLTVVQIDTGMTFTIDFHEIPGDVDFIILKQYYDIAMSRDWSVGDRFRSIIDDSWWYAVIEQHEPKDNDYPDSQFQCYEGKWMSNECEAFSPWDMEPMRDGELGEESVPLTKEEYLALMYKPELDEWPSCGRDAECDRILCGINDIMELRIAEDFLTPVDLTLYPNYPKFIEYPIDLSTIKCRLENRYYRRISGLLYDVKHISQNAEKFNVPESNIVHRANMITRVCTKFITDHTLTSAMKVYRALEDEYDRENYTYMSQLAGSDGEEEEQQAQRTSTLRKSSQPVGRPQRSPRMRQSVHYESLDSETWLSQCGSLLNKLWQSDDAEPFRYPVSLDEEPHYRNIIERPMDLSTIKENLQEGFYNSPLEYQRDIRLMFKNSKMYNVNRRSQIYGMTVRLSALFEDLIREIVSDWQSVVAYEGKVTTKQFVSDRRRPKKLLIVPEDAPPGTSGMTSTRKYAKPTLKRKSLNDDRAMEERSDSEYSGPVCYIDTKRKRGLHDSGDASPKTGSKKARTNGPLRTEKSKPVKVHVHDIISDDTSSVDDTGNNTKSRSGRPHKVPARYNSSDDAHDASINVGRSTKNQQRAKSSVADKNTKTKTSTAKRPIGRPQKNKIPEPANSGSSDQSSTETESSDTSSSENSSSASTVGQRSPTPTPPPVRAHNGAASRVRQRRKVLHYKEVSSDNDGDGQGEDQGVRHSRRNLGKQQVRYGEVEDESTDDDLPVTAKRSSKGRLVKPTAKIKRSYS